MTEPEGGNTPTLPGLTANEVRAFVDAAAAAAR
jgi:hypothetical protein